MAKIFDTENFFKLTFVDLVKGVGILWLAFTFVADTRTSIKALEAQDTQFAEILKSQTQVNQRIADYMEASDNWHSVVAGTRFKGGVPVNPSYNPMPIRDLITEGASKVAKLQATNAEVPVQ